jgi:alkylation response protein AidB-like acyl-CoA dehydrogenase
MSRYMALKLDVEDLGSLYSRFVDQVKRGEPLGEDVSILKIWAMETWQRLTELLVETGGEEGVMTGVRNIAGAKADILDSFYYSRPGTILGGTSEIQRNILSRNVPRLPS